MPAPRRRSTTPVFPLPGQGRRDRLKTARPLGTGGRGRRPRAGARRRSHQHSWFPWSRSRSTRSGKFMASRNTPTLVVTLLALGVFAANLILPESLAGCVLYVGVVLASFQSPRRDFPIYVGLGCTLLTGAN